MGTHRFYGALTALLFAAVCAYVGTALYELLKAPRESSPTPAEAQALSLYGIVLRREEAVPCAGDAHTKDGTRLSPGESLSSGSEVLSESAVFFSGTDGFEYLRPEDAAELDPEKLAGLLDSRPGQKEAGRLVYGFDFYYAAFLEGGDDISPGPCRVKFKNFQDSCRAEIISASHEGGKTALLLRLKQGTADYLSLRFTGAELIYS